MLISEQFDKTKKIEVGTIKPCPFCGVSDDLIISPKNSYNELCEEHGSSLIRITCEKCDASLTLYDIPGNNYDMGVGILVSKWNNRKE